MIEKFSSVENGPKSKGRRDFLKKLGIGAGVLVGSKILSACDLLPTSDTKEPESNINPEIQKEFEEQKKFLLDWFSRRIITDENIQNKFEEMKPKIFANLNRNIALQEEDLGRAVACNRNDTIFVDPKNLNKRNIEGVFVHELSHDAFPLLYKKETNEYVIEMPEWMYYMIDDIAKESPMYNAPDSETEGSTIGEDQREVSKAWEVYARIFVLRKKYNFLPDQVITEDILKPIIKNNIGFTSEDKDVHDLCSVVYDPVKLLYLLNKLP